MFQRLQKNFNLDFLDNKIAEEQEKQRQDAASKASASGSNPARKAAPGGKRSGAGTGAAGSKGGAKAKGQGVPNQPAVRGPDPEDFAIGDDSTEISRATTPRPTADAAPQPGSSESQPPETDDSGKEAIPVGNKAPETMAEDELPLAVRQKLAKLDTLTTRYQDLLRNYRTAHAHVATIESFEATLREHTSLTSISDPTALVEFLGQKDLQKDMAMEELRRLGGECQNMTKERDELKSKLEATEEKAKQALEEAEVLRKRRQAEGAQSADTLPKDSKSGVKATDDEFFSYDAEVSASEASEKEHVAQVKELQAKVETQQQEIRELRSQAEENEEKLRQATAEAKEHEAYINELSTENASLRQDLEITRLDLSAMNNKIRLREENIKAVESQLSATKAELEEAKQAEKAKDGKDTQRSAKRIETLEGLVNTLQTQMKTTDAESTDLRFKIQLMEAEADSAGKIIASLREHEETAKELKRKIAEVEVERDSAKRLAQTKSGHEAAAASLRSQLNRAMEDRDAAYAMILACGNCSLPQGAQSTAEGVSGTAESSAEAQAAARSEATSDSNVARADLTAENLVDGSDASPVTDGKKANKKKKSKAKKKAAEGTAGTPESKDLPTLNELIRDPTKGAEIMLRAKHAGNPILPLLLDTVEKLTQANDMKDDERDERCAHLEGLVEVRDQLIKDYKTMIQEKDEEISRLQSSVNAASTGLDPPETNGDSAQAELALRREAETLRTENVEKSAEIEKLRGRLEGEAKLTEQIENLSEENETLKESLLENGKSATDALHELKTLKEHRANLQTQLDKLTDEQSKDARKLQEIEVEKKDLEAKCASLKARLAELEALSASSGELEVLKDKLKSVAEEKASLQSMKESCEKQIDELKRQQGVAGSELDAKHEELTTEITTLKTKTSDLEKELAAANQLAQTRYKDLAETRNAYNKVQPELKRLREESAELKTVKSELGKAHATIKRLESKEKDLRAEVADYKAQVAAREADLTALKDKAKKGEERSKALEESFETARKDLIKSESTRNEAVEIREKLQGELRKLGDDLKKSKAALEGLEKKVQKHSTEASGLREELQIKSAQQASAQSLMDSMRDQTTELSTQMKELREQKDSLAEELADANRLLSERSREAETMRRLLADVEGRAESRVKEMRERMDLAVEERDRAEDEASNVAKRRAREIEDYKLKLHDAEREVSRATEARRDAEKRVRDLQEHETELQRKSLQAQEELTEVRTAMAQLRDALDAGERQSQQLEKERAELRKTLEDKEVRLERLQKSSKAMAEELRLLQQQQQTTTLASPRSAAPVKPSPRASVESARVASPTMSSGGAAGKKDAIDYVYLKNILLQFLEQKEKKHQMQLVPVLGMLLHFDRAEEQKWMAAISAK